MRRKTQKLKQQAHLLLVFFDRPFILARVNWLGQDKHQLSSRLVWFQLIGPNCKPFLQLCYSSS